MTSEECALCSMHEPEPCFAHGGRIYCQHGRPAGHMCPHCATWVKPLYRKIGIVGSREYENLRLVRAFVRTLPQGTIVVSGGARGVDIAAENEAKACGLNVEIHYAQWREKDGRVAKGAGFVRNRHIARASHWLVAFWDGVSGGTSHTIGCMKELHKPVTIAGPKIDIEQLLLLTKAIREG